MGDWGICSFQLQLLVAHLFWWKLVQLDFWELAPFSRSYWLGYGLGSHWENGITMIPGKLASFGR